MYLQFPFCHTGLLSRVAIPGDCYECKDQHDSATNITCIKLIKCLSNCHHNRYRIIIIVSVVPSMEGFLG